MPQDATNKPLRTGKPEGLFIYGRGPGRVASAAIADGFRLRQGTGSWQRKHHAVVTKDGKTATKTVTMDGKKEIRITP